jgi:hypothetical protein
MVYLLIFISTWIFVNLRRKGTLLEVFVYLLFLLANHLLELMLLPNVDSFEEGGTAGCEVPFALLDDGSEGALNVNLVLAIVVFF